MQRQGALENKVDEKYNFERYQYLNDKVIITYNSFLVTQIVCPMLSIQHPFYPSLVCLPVIQRLEK